MKESVESVVAQLAVNKDRWKPEQVRDTLAECFTSENPQHALDLLDQKGLLDFFLPEVTAQKGVEQPPEWHAKNDVYLHVRSILGYMRHPTPEMAFTVLLHDVGKPPTYQKDIHGKITFKNHARVGAEMTQKRLAALKFSKKFIEEVVALVDRHMDFDNADKMSEGELSRLFNHPNIEKDIEFQRLDLLGCHGPNSKMSSDGQPENYNFLMQKLQDIRKASAPS